MRRQIVLCFRQQTYGCFQDKLQETETLLKQYGLANESHLHKSQVLVQHMDAALTIGALLYKLDGSEQLTDVSFKAEHQMFQQYTTKVKKAVGRQELSNQRKKTEVNVDAMHRFIEHAVPDLDQDQKQQLKQVLLHMLLTAIVSTCPACTTH